MPEKSEVETKEEDGKDRDGWSWWDLPDLLETLGFALRAIGWTARLIWGLLVWIADALRN